MYFLKDGSDTTDAPCIKRMEQTSNNPKERQYLFYPDLLGSRWVYHHGIQERTLIHWVLDNFIDPTKNFIDIGAHVGAYTWSCGKKAKHTYAFECSPKTFCYLAANVALHGLEYKTTLYSYALGPKQDTMTYYIRSEEGGDNGLKKLSVQDDNAQSVTVQVRTLDSFQLENIGFIKIDVEGFEKNVLEGSLETLKNNGYPTFIFESWAETKENVDAKQIRKELFEFIISIGYKIVSIQGTKDEMFLAVH